MANYVVWIDLEHTKIFELHATKVEETKLNRREIHHHTGFEKGQNAHKNSEKFFHQVAEHLAGAHQILLVGPGNAKTHFKEHLEQHDRQLEKKVVGVETVDHPTDGQIVALGKRFFRAHLPFE